MIRSLTPSRQCRALLQVCAWKQLLVLKMLNFYLHYKRKCYLHMNLFSKTDIIFNNFVYRGEGTKLLHSIRASSVCAS